LYCVLVQGVDEILVPVVIVVLGCWCTWSNGFLCTDYCVLYAVNSCRLGIDGFTLVPDSGQMSVFGRSWTGHLDTGFLAWFPCVFKANAEMVPKFPSW